MVFLAQAAEGAERLTSNLVVMIVLLAILGLVPFILTMVTSFAKLVIVGGLIRQALGTPQIPPTAVVTGLALIVTLHIMSPVAVTMYGEYRRLDETGAPEADVITRVAQSTLPPLDAFLRKHCDPRNVELFRSLRAELQGSEGPFPDLPLTPAQVDTITILAPAFVLTELTEAFQIGFLIFVPFLVLDLVVSNVLLALGMHMLSPVTISLPLKILLFVLIDGWTLILRGIVLGYA